MQDQKERPGEKSQSLFPWEEVNGDDAEANSTFLLAREEIQTDYRSHPAASYSAISLWLTNPRLYEKKYLLGETVDKDSSGFLLGSALDARITDTSYAERHHHCACEISETTNAGRFLHALSRGLEAEQAYAEAGIKRPSLETLIAELEADKALSPVYTAACKGMALLSPRQAAAVEGMAAEYARIERKLLGGVAAQRVFQKPYAFSVDGVSCKTLPDAEYLMPLAGRVLVVDIKTTSASLNGTAREMERLNYWIQASMHLLAARAHHPGLETEAAFVFLSTAPPYNGRVVKVSMDEEATRFRTLLSCFRQARIDACWDFPDQEFSI